jgi:hypothetical protein
MENPTKAITATLRTMVAIPATSILDRLDAMDHFWRQPSGGVDLDHGVRAALLPSRKRAR